MTALKVLMIKIHREASETFKQGLYPSVNSCAKAYNVDRKTLSRMITDNRDYIGGGRQSGIFTAEEESKLLGFVSERLRLGCDLYNGFVSNPDFAECFKDVARIHPSQRNTKRYSERRRKTRKRRQL